MISSIPNHIAIIPDGNRRWAKKRSLKPWLGHRQAFDTIRPVCEELFAAGVKYLTLWAASPDNLTKRPVLEIKFLLKYIREGLMDKELLEFCQTNGVRVTVVGAWKKLIADKDVHAAIESIQSKTAGYSSATLTILLAYDGRSEMLDAIKHLQSAHGVTEKTVHNSLWTADLPPVDLVIRTGGEPHWSAGFMMWLTADSQFYFTETLWPDFNAKEAGLALKDYARRQRRLGA